MKKVLFFTFFLLALFSKDLAYAKSDLAHGFDYLNNGDPKAALSYFSQAVSSGDAELVDYAIFGMGRAEFDLGNYEPAILDFKKVITEYNESAILEDANYFLAKSFARAKKFDEALKQIENYLKDYDEGIYTGELSYLKAEILEEQGEFRRAYSAYNDVDLFYPLSAYSKKARLKMKALAKKHKFSSYKPNPKKLYARGEEFFENGNYEIAAALFNRLARSYPKHKLTAKAFLMLGRAEMERGEADASIQNIERSYRLSYGTEQGRSLYYLGRAYGRRGRYEKAINIMSKVLFKYPKSNYADDALYYLAIYYEKTDSPQAALGAYISLIVNYPVSRNVDDAILRAGHLYYARGDYENAFTVYSLAKKYRADDETPQCLFLWGLTAEKLGKTDSAAGIYYYVAEKFDHTYQSYRAKDKLSKMGYVKPHEKLSLSQSLNSSEIDESNVDEVMEKWKRKNQQLLSSKEISKRLNRYTKLYEEGLAEYAYLEAKELLQRSEGETKESAQQVLAKVMQKSGEFTVPIRYMERKIKKAVFEGYASRLSADIWQLAYPKGYWGKVYEASSKYGLDPYLTLAVIREESRFNPRALSRSRAHGLMQIIPSTGRIIARQLDIQPFKRSKMYQPELNIEMGTYYLSNLIRRFDGNVTLALAGYNGGPVRVKKWVDNWYNGDTVNLDIDEFVQNIPLLETRKYVQKVLGSYYEYKRIYDGRRS